MHDLTTVDQITQKIQELHASAQSHAETAVSHAVEAGTLLLGLKRQLPHGQFLGHVSKNMNISIRQCQRYMAASQGKSPLALSDLTGKSDTMSHLGGKKVSEIFLPAPGRVYMLPNQNGSDIQALIEPASGLPKYFFITVYNKNGEYHQTKRPVEVGLVHDNLEYFGIHEPHKQAWRWKKSSGVRAAEETLYGPTENPHPIKPLNAPRPIKNVGIDEKELEKLRQNPAKRLTTVLNIKNAEIDWDHPYRGIKLPEGYPRPE